jgi:hypothetical protein
MNIKGELTEKAQSPKMLFARASVDGTTPVSLRGGPHIQKDSGYCFHQHDSGGITNANLPGYAGIR